MANFIENYDNNKRDQIIGITMPHLTVKKVHTRYLQGTKHDILEIPRCYTLTHSDSTGDLFLTIGPNYERQQISGLYTRLMRDEVLAEWKIDSDKPSLNVFCHISGGLVFGRAGWRNTLFRNELPLVLETFRYGDKAIYDNYPKLDESPIIIYFQSSNKKYDRIEKWGIPADYKIS